jgi:hypothetical protein
LPTDVVRSLRAGLVWRRSDRRLVDVKTARGRWFRTLTCVIAAVLGLGVAWVSRASATSPRLPTLAQLEADLVVAAKASTVPNLTTTIPAATDTNWWETQPYPVRTACFVTSGSTLPKNPRASCSFGDLTATRTILLIGDSHAAMLAPAIDVAARSLHWRVILLARHSCPPWLDPFSVDYYGKSTVECNQWNRNLDAYANASHPAVLMPVGRPGEYRVGIWPTAGDIANKMEALFKAVKPSRAKLVLLGGTPWFYNPYTPNECLASTTIPAKCEATPTAVSTPVFDQGLATAAKAYKATIVPIMSLFCTATVCPLFVRGPDGTRLLYFDTNHIYRYYSAWIGIALAKLVSPSL